MIVTAQKNISYSVDEVRKSIAELNEIPFENTSEEEAIALIWNFITEDFGDSYGVVLLDEEGQEIQDSDSRLNVVDTLARGIAPPLVQAHCKNAMVGLWISCG